MTLNTTAIVEKYGIEYVSFFTVDAKSADVVEKQSKQLVASLETQDSRYTSIVNKLKKIAGPEGVKAYTTQLEEARSILTQLAVQNEKVEKNGRGISKSKERQNKLMQESVVAMERLNEVQNEIVIKAKEEERARQAIANSIPYENKLVKERLAAGKKEVANEKERISLLKETEAMERLSRQEKVKAAGLEWKQQQNLHRNKQLEATRERDLATYKKRMIAIYKKADDKELIRKKAIANAQRKTTVPQASSSTTSTAAGGPMDTLGNRKDTFQHKIFSTMQYTAAAAGIFAVSSAFREAAVSMVEFDSASRALNAVIEGTTLTQTRALEEQLISLGVTYGGTVEDINKAAIELGRAGIASKDLVKATEITIKLAKLTGDSLEVSSSAMISYLEVYSKAGETVESLGDKLAFMANESRLSTQDIGTFSNFALAAADASGITVDAVSALATQFSKAGVNASTIGTQIRSLTKVFLDNSEGVGVFFDELSMVQKTFQADLAAGGEQSNKALVDLSKKLSSLTKAEFNRITASMDILQRNSLALLRQQSEGISSNIKTLTTDMHEGISAVDAILGSHVSTWERFKAALVSSSVEFDKLTGTTTFFTRALEQLSGLLSGQFGNTVALQKLDYKLAMKSLEIEELRAKKREAFSKKERSDLANKERQAGIQLLSIQKQVEARKKLMGLTPTTGVQEIDLGSKGNIEDRLQSLSDERLAIEAKSDALNKQLEIEKKAGKISKELRGEIKKTNSLLSRSDKEIKANVDAWKEYDEEGKAVQGKIVAVLRLTHKETRALTSATIELFKSGNIDVAQASAPYLAISKAIGSVQEKINNLANTEGSIGIKKELDSIISGSTELEDLMVEAYKLQVLQEKVGNEQVGNTKEDVEAHNKRLALIEREIVLYKQAITLASEKEKISNAENAALNKRYANIMKLVKAENEIRGTKLAMLYDSRDLLGIEGQKVSVAYENWQTSLKIQDTEEAITNSKKLEETYDASILKYKKLQTVEGLKYRATLTGINGNLTKQIAAAQRIGGLESDRQALAETQEENRKKLLIDLEKMRATDEDRVVQLEKIDKLHAIQMAKLQTMSIMGEEFVDAFGTSLNSALSDAAKGINSWSDAAENFKNSLIDIALQLLVIKPLIESIKMAGGSGTEEGFSIGTLMGGIFGSANGNVYSGGSPDMRYATGGIVNRPVLFPQTDGNTGLMGEAGPEAILPLTRIGGDLGVKADFRVESGTGNTEITIINESGMPMDLKDLGRQKDDSGTEFVTLLMTSLNYNPDVRQAIKSL